jgi:hypothetical protein
MHPKALTVYKSPYAKKRIGKDNDGGYVIVEIPNVQYNLLLAGGIKNDISFEEAFSSIYGSRCVAFDGTINNLPKLNTNIEFVKKNIGAGNTDTLTNLHEYIDINEKIFVKMDIEGGEIPWIKSLSDTQMYKFEQIVIEFHKPYTKKKEDGIFAKMNKHHVLVHFHPNNCCGTRIYKGVVMPNIFECTYLHKKYFVNEPKLNTDPVPSEIDMQNIKEKKEIILNHPPFVN